MTDRMVVMVIMVVVAVARLTRHNSRGFAMAVPVEPAALADSVAAAARAVEGLMVALRTRPEMVATAAMEATAGAADLAAAVRVLARADNRPGLAL
jgi:hypothetical protein